MSSSSSECEPCKMVYKALKTEQQETPTGDLLLLAGVLLIPVAVVALAIAGTMTKPL